MKNYFNKALFYKEWRNIRAIALVVYLEIITMIIIPFINTIDYVKSDFEGIHKSEEIIFRHNNILRYFKTQDSHILMIFILIAIATCVVGYDFMGKKYDILNSMPFKKSEIIFTKWCSIFITTIIPLGIGYFTVYGLYCMNKDVLGMHITSKMVLTWIAINLLVSIFVFTFIMLIQCLSGICGVGGVIGLIFLILPVGIGMLIDGILMLFEFKPNTYISQYSEIISRKLFNIGTKLTPPSYGFNIPYEADEVKQYYMPTKLRIIVLVIVIIITFVLMMYAFNKLKLENTGYIVAFRQLEGIFKIGVSICFGLLGGTMTAAIARSHYDLWNLRDNNAPELAHLVNKSCTLTILIGLLCGCVVYVVTNKILEANKK